MFPRYAPFNDGPPIRLLRSLLPSLGKGDFVRKSVHLPKYFLKNMVLAEMVLM